MTPLGRDFPPVREEAAFHPAVFLAEHKDRRPVVYREAVAAWPAAAWTPASLGERFGDRKLVVRRCAPGSSETFLEQTLGSGERVSLAAYVDHLEGRGSSLPGTAREWAVRDAHEALQAMPELGADLPFGSLFPDTRWPWDLTLWMGPAGYVTGLHVDIVDVNLLAHLYGTKEMVLFSPAETFHLYPAGRVLLNGLYSEVDPYEPDLTRHPKVAEARGLRVELRPGDLMYVPNGWWHLVRADEVTISASGGVEHLPRS